MKKIVVLAALTVAAAGTVGALSGLGGAAGTEPTPGLERVSAVGTPVGLAQRDAAILRRFEHSGRFASGGAQAHLLGVAGDQALYRLNRRDGAACFAAGPANLAGERFGEVTCSETFPSQEQPILDLTVFHGSVENPTVYRTQGIASDGVASVAFKNAAGDIVAKTAVVDNVYRIDPIPAGELAAIVAFDKNGKIVAELPI
jgi:hypothetical protein